MASSLVKRHSCQLPAPATFSLQSPHTSYPHPLATTPGQTRMLLIILNKRYKLYYQMGNKQSRSSKLPKFKKQNWHMIPTIKFCRTEYGLYYLYRNNLTSQQVEEYQIYFHNEAEYDKYLEFFEWRQQEDSIVNSKFINSEEIKEFCNTNHNAKIYIEHIPVRLSHIQDIPFPENLYVLFSALDGFEKIFFWVGYFEPSEDMVCVDGDGKVKVWLNVDLSKCNTSDSQFADETSHFRSMPQYEEQMVTEIIELVEQNTSDEVEASMTFTQHLWHTFKGKKLSFKQAKQEVINYALKNNTTIPNYFESVMSIFTDDHQSELQSPSEKLPLTSQRARNEENRIIAKNRQTNNPSRTNSHHQMQPTGYEVPQESIIINSQRRQTEARASSFQRVLDESQRLPSFSMLNAPQRAIAQYEGGDRAQSPEPVRGSVQQQSQSNGFQIRFNYQAAPASPHVNPHLNFHSVPRNLERRTVPSHPAYPSPPHSSYQSINSPIQLLPSNHPQPEPRPQQQQQQQQLQPQQLFQPFQNLQEPSAYDQTRNRASKITKLVYSDTNDTYELDNEIAKDIQKYFGGNE